MFSSISFQFQTIIFYYTSSTIMYSYFLQYNIFTGATREGNLAVEVARDTAGRRTDTGWSCQTFHRGTTGKIWRICSTGAERYSTSTLIITGWYNFCLNILNNFIMVGLVMFQNELINNNCNKQGLTFKLVWTSILFQLKFFTIVLKMFFHPIILSF